MIASHRTEFAALTPESLPPSFGSRPCELQNPISVLLLVAGNILGCLSATFFERGQFSFSCDRAGNPARSSRSAVVVGRSAVDRRLVDRRLTVGDTDVG